MMVDLGLTNAVGLLVFESYDSLSVVQAAGCHNFVVVKSMEESNK